MQAVSQRLTAKHTIPMVEFPQTVGNLTEASSNLYELVKGRNLVAYPDDAMRLAVQRSVAVETSRGWRIAKEKASHKIDVVVALGMAAHGAVQEASKNPSWFKDLATPEFMARTSQPFPGRVNFFNGNYPSRVGGNRNPRAVGW